ncbi:MAG: type II secretion system protein [Cetobacterium sp.]|uniref:type II secretion system protein n=1 Tax=unclassified Cetobacterium TaxID=2630983 RepID=UPI00163C638A|nr:type II secretion system protein [Cetobacterium sp. 2A]MBC2856310.1 type II secretion system protein [Cetobacterium sp. 2A]
MSKNKYSKGMTYLEVLVVISIIGFLTIGSYLKYIKVLEMVDLKDAKLKIVETYSLCAIKSLDLQQSFKVDLFMKEKYIDTELVLVGNIDKIEKKEKIQLPKKLRYATVYDNSVLTEIRAKTTITGNLNKSFTVYIFDYKDLAKYRIAFYIYQTNKFLQVNIYENINASGATYSNIEKYHKSSEGQNHIGWQKE